MLSLEAGALAGYPGAALVVSAAGAVVTANEAGKALAGRFGRHLPAELEALVRQALGGCRVRQGTSRLEAQKQPVFLDATVLPAADGETALLLVRDVSLEGRLRAALVESRLRYKDLVEISSDFAWETGPDGRFAFVSPRGALGWSAERLVGCRPDEFLAGAQAGALPFSATRRIEGVEVRFRRADGSTAILEASGGPIGAQDGCWQGARGICRDVTMERERAAALARARNREGLINRIVRAIRDEVDPANMLTVAASATGKALAAEGGLIFRADTAGTFTVAAEYRAGDLAPAALELIEGLQVADFPDVEHGEMEHGNRRIVACLTRYRRRANGAIALWRDRTAAPWQEDDRLLLSEVTNQLGIAIEQITKHESILDLSRTDMLTGLLNRRAFFDDFGRRFARVRRGGGKAALIYVDLDNFKLVNDRHGHQRGDEALSALRDLLTRHTRPDDLVARLGGDEFALWLEETDAETAAARAIRLLDESRNLGHFTGDPTRPLGISLGIAILDPARPETLEGLLARADAAMYRVKHGGKGSYLIAPPAPCMAAAPPSEPGG